MTRINRIFATLLLAAFAFAGTACDSLLQVSNPGAVGEDALQSEEALTVVVDGVYGDLQDALDEVVEFAALMTDELAHSGSFPSYAQIDDREIVNNNVEIIDLFQEIATARFSADQAAALIRAVLGPAAESDARLAEALNYGGYARIFYADNFCQATIDGGPALSPAELYGQAEDLFTEAIAVATAAGDAEMENLARVGRARARLNLGDNGGALSDAQAVPAGFEFFIEFSDNSARETNEVWIFTVSRNEMSIGEPFWNHPGIEQCSVHPASTVGPCPFNITGPFGPDNETPLFVPLKYGDVQSNGGADIRLASGEEAALIAAEAAGQDVSEERSITLFLEGHRLADMRRNGDAFLAGGDSCFPIPDREVDTNPNL
ncbi:MAG TPA: hypothetical protein VM778_01580 [Gemmatimonadota bacterium]|nr:hypothetical protein [Gemmatimonadota bacterium]